jgi:EAL domain-containing protein (putative c-di-GMP-specific phosphodiesterase class I)
MGNSTKCQERAGIRHELPNPCTTANPLDTIVPNVATRGGVALRTFVTESDLVELIATRALSVVFQPLWQVDAARVIGFEALARFPFGEPQEWFLAARTYGLEAELDRLAMEKALEAYAGSGGEALLFANVDIPETPWPLRAGGVDLDRLGSRVVLEVTERMMGRGRDLYSAVAELRRHGFGLAVDDMGTGASDDHRVELLAPEYLKLERTLLERMFRRGDPVAWQEARRHLALAREIGAEVLAEGVEDLAWLGELTAVGVNLAQGYALGRPAPLAHWLDGEAVDEVARALRACGVVQGGPPGVLERRRVAEWLEVSQERLATDLGRWLAVRHAEPGTVRRLLRLLMGMLRMDGRPAALASDERAELRALSADAVVVSHLLPLMRGPIRRLAEAQGLAPPEVGALVAAVDRLEMFLVRERLRQERHEGALAREEARNRSEGLGVRRDGCTIGWPWRRGSFCARTSPRWWKRGQTGRRWWPGRERACWRRWGSAGRRAAA